MNMNRSVAATLEHESLPWFASGHVLRPVWGVPSNKNAIDGRKTAIETSASIFVLVWHAKSAETAFLSAGVTGSIASIDAENDWTRTRRRESQNKIMKSNLRGNQASESCKMHQERSSSTRPSRGALRTRGFLVGGGAVNSSSGDKIWDNPRILTVPSIWNTGRVTIEGIVSAIMRNTDTEGDSAAMMRRECCANSKSWPGLEARLFACNFLNRRRLEKLS